MASPSHGLAALEAHAEEVASAVPLADAVDTDRVGRYRGYGELVERLVTLGSGRGCEAVAAGVTVNANPIFALGVGDADASLVSVVLAGVHAMEWIGVEAAMALLEALVAEPPRGRLVLFLPVINVDGYRRAEADLRGGRWRFVRTNASGVDLNRNWPTLWRRRWLSRLMPWIGSSGDHPASEPEVAAVLGLLDDEVALGRSIDRAVSLHSFGRMILHPYGGRFGRPERLETYRDAASAVRGRISERYRVVQVSRWYPGFSFAHGMEIDHLHEGYGATALLVECSRGGFRLTDPTSWLHPFRWYNPRDVERTTSDLRGGLEPFLRGEG